MSAQQRQALFENTARSIGGAPREIQLRHVRHCLRADPAYGVGVAKALGIEAGEIGFEVLEADRAELDDRTMA